MFYRPGESPKHRTMGSARMFNEEERNMRSGGDIDKTSA